MKKIFAIGVVLLSLAACKKEAQESQPTPVEPDKISVSPTSRTVGGDGGTAATTVTSSSEWTLEAADGKTYDWITADKNSGKSGETVTFEVDPNSDADKTASFVFRCGKAEASFTVTSTAKEVVIPELTLKSESPVAVGYESGEFTVELSLKNVEDVSKLEAKANDSWVSFSSPATAGAEAETAVMKFTYEANANTEARETEITISYPNADPVVVKVQQTGKPATSIVITSEKNISVEYTEGTFRVELETSNDVSVSGISGNSDVAWVKYIGTDFGAPGTAVMNFSYTANDASTAREATVTVKYDGKEYGTVTVAQKGMPEVAGDPLITKALYMTGYCAGYGYNGWTNKEVMKFGKTISVEMLVKHEGEFDDSIGSLFGTERRLLIRHGDSGTKGKWELVYGLNATNYYGENSEAKVKSSVELPADKWVHIAVVFDEASNTVLLYQDGQEVGRDQINSDIKSIDLNDRYFANGQNQQFYLGRSYDNGRGFKGLMSEVRVWSKALTKEEINSTNHFYTVDPESEGLVAYWKLNDGEGTAAKDNTGNGNDLSIKQLYGDDPASQIWGAGAKWVDVSLPE